MLARLLHFFWHFFWLDRPIRQRGTVIVAIPVICLFVSLIAIASLRDRAIQVRRRIDSNKEILQETNRLLKTVVDAETAIRGYGLTKQREFLAPYWEAKKSLPSLLVRIQNLVAQNQFQTQQFAAIAQRTEQQIDFLQNTLNKLDNSAVKLSPSQVGEVFARSKFKMDALRQTIDVFAAAGEASQKSGDRQIQQLIDIINLVQVAGLFVGFLGAAASWYLFDSLEKELKNRETSLQESKTRIQAVVDNAADGIITLDEVGNIQSFNNAAEQIFGWKAEQIIGSNLRRLIAKPRTDNSTGDYSIEYFG